MMFMFGRQSAPELEAELREVEKSISAHPLASERVVEAQKLVEERKGADQEALSRELADRNLPGLDELGQIQLRSTASWWRLHRDQKRLMRRLQRLRR